MRTAAVVGVILLAPAAFAAPQTSATGGGYLDYSVLDSTPESSSVLQADVLAAAAAINQQIYQSTTNPTQWKKCNRDNAIYRREWFVTRINLIWRLI
jgi:tyrosinase